MAGVVTGVMQKNMQLLEAFSQISGRGGNRGDANKNMQLLEASRQLPGRGGNRGDAKFFAGQPLWPNEILKLTSGPTTWR